METQVSQDPETPAAGSEPLAADSYVLAVLRQGRHLTMLQRSVLLAVAVLARNPEGEDAQVGLAQVQELLGWAPGDVADAVVSLVIAGLLIEMPSGLVCTPAEVPAWVRREPPARDPQPDGVVEAEGSRAMTRLNAVLAKHGVLAHRSAVDQGPV